MRASGPALILASASAFGAMGVFGRLAYNAGATPGTLLSTRFVLAAALSWAALCATRAGRSRLRGLSRRDALLGLGLGGGIYAGQAGGYFVALQRLDPSLLSLLVYTYPAMVAVLAVALGREHLDARRLAALACASGGLVLVVAGAGTGALDPLGAALGIATACVYSAYILASQRIAARLAPSVLSALVCTGAAASVGAAAAALGQLRPEDVRAAGWGWLSCLALVSTVLAIALFFAGLRRVGPTAAAILSTAEPLVTVVLAFLVLGDALTPVQLLGGALVLAAALVLQAPVRARVAVRRALSAAAGGSGP